MKPVTLLTEDSDDAEGIAHLYIRRGITHELAHTRGETFEMALWLAAASDLPAAVSVGTLVTTIALSGPPEQVAAGVRGIGDRWRQVLDGAVQEGSGHSGSGRATEIVRDQRMHGEETFGLVSEIAMRRFGRQGFGLVGMPPNEVTDSAAARESAIALLRRVHARDVVLTGVNLDLPRNWLDLPDGDVAPIPVTEQLPTPFAIAEDGAVAVDVMVGAAPVSRYVGMCLLQSLYEAVPEKAAGGVGVVARDSHIPGVGRQACWAIDLAGVPGADARAVAARAHRAIGRLVERGPTDSEQEFARRIMEQGDVDLSPLNEVTRAGYALLLPEVDYGPLPGEATDPAPNPTPEQFTAALTEILQSAIVVAPPDSALYQQYETRAVPPSDEPLEPADTPSRHASGVKPAPALVHLRGQQSSSIAAPQRMSVTDAGVAWSTPIIDAAGRRARERFWRTIPADQVVLVRQYQDGERTPCIFRCSET